MSDIKRIEKKLDALIDALGFDVEATGEQSHINEDDLKNMLGPNRLMGLYRTTECTLDYKLTKQPESPFQWMETNSEAWGAIVEYVLSNRGEIEEGVDDFGVLMPVLNHFNGVEG